MFCPSGFAVGVLETGSDLAGGAVNLADEKPVRFEVNHAIDKAAGVA